MVEFAGRRRLANVDTGEELVVDVMREEGLVSQVGDTFSAGNMNELEQRISDALGGYSIQVVNALPSERDETVLYFVRKV